jgi:NarL family two-component system response regulator YdfI
MIKLIIAASSPMVRAGLEALIRSDGRFDIAGIISNPQDLVAAIENVQPDVVLLEMDEDGDLTGLLPGVEPEVAETRNGPAFVLLVDHPEDDWLIEALRSGARAVLTCTATPAQITAAIESVASGLVVAPVDLINSMLPAQRLTETSETGPRGEALTGREIEVLGMLAEGLANKTIAYRLGISEHTVKFHVSSIFGKLSAGSRTEAVTIGIRRGLIML